MIKRNYYKLKNLTLSEAFTLIEVLVSISIISIMAISLLGLFSISVKANFTSKQIVEKTVCAKSLLEKTKSDLRSEFNTDPGLHALKDVITTQDGYSINISSTQYEGLYLLIVTYDNYIDEMTSYIYFSGDCSFY